MRRLLLLLVVSAAAALVVPTVFAGTPNGAGLYREHRSSCTGAFTYQGLVTLVPGSGNSFWVDGRHLVIQRAEVTDTATGATVVYTFGVKNGRATPTGMETCVGDFPGYHVVSHDVVVP